MCLAYLLFVAVILLTHRDVHCQICNTFSLVVTVRISNCICFWRDNTRVSQNLIIHEVSRSHNDAPQSVGLLWTSNQRVAETST